jgi:hypothetical protein
MPPIHRQCSKIKTALPARFDKNLCHLSLKHNEKSYLHNRLAMNSILFNARRTETHEFEFCCVDSLYFAGIYHCTVRVMREEFRVAKIAVSLKLQHV